ncbi:MAG: ArsR/SmtB family transcription factor [Alphaproteobacteria bacterium]
MTTAEALINGLKAAGEPTRLRVLALLADHELTVTELTQILGQSQPRVSRHLKLLVEAGLIRRFSEGTWAFYRATDQGLSEQLIPLIPKEDPEISRDLDRLQQVIEERAQKAQDYFAENANAWDELRALHVADEAVEAAFLKKSQGLRPQKLLDIGTGTGRILEIFAGQIELGIGVDLSSEMLALARFKLESQGLSHCQVRRADLFALPFEGGEFDLITLHQVLHYLDRPQAAIREAARTLAPGGRLIIADFAPHDLEFLRENQAHRRLGFADAEIQEPLKMAGLTLHDPLYLTPPNTNKGAQKQPLTVTVWCADKSK